MKQLFALFLCSCFLTAPLVGEEKAPVESGESEPAKIEKKDLVPAKKEKKLKKASQKSGHPSEHPSQKEVELAPPAPPVY